MSVFRSVFQPKGLSANILEVSKENGIDVILEEIRSLRLELTENREQLAALREDVNTLVKKQSEIS